MTKDSTHKPANMVSRKFHRWKGGKQRYKRVPRRQCLHCGKNNMHQKTMFCSNRQCKKPTVPQVTDNKKACLHIQHLCQMADKELDSEFSDNNMALEDESGDESEDESVETQAVAEQRMLKNILERRKDEGKVFMVCEGRVNPVTGEPEVILYPAQHVQQDLYDMRLAEKKLLGDIEAEKKKVVDLNARLDAAKKMQFKLDEQLVARDLAMMQHDNDHKKLQGDHKKLLDEYKKKGSEYRAFTQRMEAIAAHYQKVLDANAQLVLQKEKNKLNFQARLIEAHEKGAREASKCLSSALKGLSEKNKPKVLALRRYAQEMRF